MVVIKPQNPTVALARKHGARSILEQTSTTTTATSRAAAPRRCENNDDVECITFTTTYLYYAYTAW